MKKYAVFGYAIKANQEPFTRQYHNQLFFTKHEAVEFCAQHRLNSDEVIVQLFNQETIPYVEPKDWVEP